MSPEVSEPFVMSVAEPLALSVVDAQERAQIDLQISTAKRYPRNLQQVRRKLEEMAMFDEETAESCNYHLIRDGHSIEGPSVKLAEMAVACYGNIRAGAKSIGNDGRVVTAQGVCYDLENNVFISWDSDRRITDKRGRQYSEDMIVTTTNAAKAVAYRNAVFKVIPSALVKSVADKAKHFAAGDLKTLTQRRTRLLKRFAAIGVNEQMILKLLGYTSADEITISDVEKLIGIGTAIREGTTTVEEQFPRDDASVKPNIPSAESAQEKAQETASIETADTQSKPAKSSPSGSEKVKTSKKAGNREQVEEKLKTDALSYREQVEQRLEADAVTLEEFLKILDGFGIVAKSLDDLDERFLKMALANWENQILKERKK